MMKKLMALLLLVVIARAEDRIVIVNQRKFDPQRIGGFAGGLPTRGNVNFEPSAPIPDEWREWRGEIYNVAVKQRWQESMTEKNRWGRVYPLPGWDLLAGDVVSASAGRVEIVTRYSEHVTVTGMTEHFGRGQKVRMYARRIGPGLVYEYGKPISAEEAQRILAEKKLNHGETEARSKHQTGGSTNLVVTKK